MTAFAAAPPSRSPGFSRRLPTALAGAALGLATAALAWRLSPSTALLAPVALGAFALSATLGLAATLEESELTRSARAFGLGALAVGAAAASGIGADRLELAFGLAALGLFGFAAYNLARRGHRRLGAPGPALALLATLLATLAIYNVYYVQASRDLMIADFMFYRKVSIAVASLIDSGRILGLIADLAGSMKEDYSWAPALAPGLVMAIGGPLSRTAYQTGMLVFYPAPAATPPAAPACRGGARAHSRSSPSRSSRSSSPIRTASRSRRGACPTSAGSRSTSTLFGSPPRWGAPPRGPPAP